MKLKCVAEEQRAAAARISNYDATLASLRDMDARSAAAGLASKQAGVASERGRVDTLRGVWRDQVLARP